MAQPTRKPAAAAQVAQAGLRGMLAGETIIIPQADGKWLWRAKRMVPEQLRAQLSRAYRNGMFTNGLGTIETDELHAYEEGINTNSALLLLNWGQPWAVERLMETVNALHTIIKPNPQGHWLFSSNWFSGKKIYGEGNWVWQNPYSFPIMHPAIMLGEFNADRRSRNLVTKLADGYMAYGYTAEDGYQAQRSYSIASVSVRESLECGCRRRVSEKRCTSAVSDAVRNRTRTSFPKPRSVEIMFGTSTSEDSLRASMARATSL